MLRRHSLALALATALLLSVAAWPAAAAPAPAAPESPSFVSTVIAWIYQAVGLDTGDLQVRSKSETTGSPDLTSSDSDPLTTFSSGDDGSEEPDPELGTAWDPGG